MTYRQRKWEDSAIRFLDSDFELVINIFSMISWVDWCNILIAFINEINKITFSIIIIITFTERWMIKLHEIQTETRTVQSKAI